MNSLKTSLLVLSPLSSPSTTIHTSLSFLNFCKNLLTHLLIAALALQSCTTQHAFILWCWRRLLRVSWTARISNQSVLKGNKSPTFTGRTYAETEAPILWPPDVKSWLVGKDPDDRKDWGKEEKRATEDKVVGWHHWLNGEEFKQTLRDSDGQGSLGCCSSWGCRVRHDLATKQQ